MPLLPLHRVVLPGSSLVVPLYDSDAHDLVEELEGDRFGTVLIRPDAVAGRELHGVGTELRIIGPRAVDVDVPMVHVVGERRFEVTEWLDHGTYTVASVTFSEETGASDLAHLRDAVARRFRRYLAVLAESGQGGMVYDEVVDDPVAASYQVASAMRLTSPERQELLELVVAERLERELMLLAHEIELLERVMR